MIKHEVHNWDVNVGDIRILGVSTSSVFLIGDSEEIKLTSFFDTPPESYIFGSVVPLSRHAKE
ncbi:spore gernimation protein GerPD [Aquibacillus sp. 3ASR75-11]|uniref:Spore gernimation protein GerPD n=1 Tax=Terrihalobacillus insolitus TaxID=2950438 RepID=A0A9X4API3_9BACI|nr:spore gernimation protein GerPD [Terrihalobacillus insolitus]MDC3413729.1 spore gernimation protein GerPD [Terrihalobacillus insolitus]MDC3425588.1 spore gernimation protein GerPD [Terrihalobacillus insolitus]